MSSGKSQMLFIPRDFSGCWIHSAHHRRLSLKVSFDSAEWIRNSNHDACKPRDYSHYEEHIMEKSIVYIIIAEIFSKFFKQLSPWTADNPVSS